MTSCRNNDPRYRLNGSGTERSAATTRSRTQILFKRGMELNRKKQIVRHVRRRDKQIGHEALHQQRSLHEEKLVQQQRDAQRNLLAEASMLAAQTSTQLHAQFRVMGHHTSAEQDEFYRNQMQEIAIQAVETTDAQRQLYFQEAGEEPRRNEDGSGSLVNYLESRSQNQSLESSTRDRI